MNGRFLLDTNFIIDLLANRSHATDFISKTSEAFVPIISFAELFYGAYKSKQKEQNIRETERIYTQYPSVGITWETTQIFGRIKARLKELGRPIPDHDIWIAALAEQNELTLVTRDMDFRHVEGLDVTFLAPNPL